MLAPRHLEKYNFLSKEKVNGCTNDIGLEIIFRNILWKKKNN